MVVQQLVVQGASSSSPTRKESSPQRGAPQPQCCATCCQSGWTRCLQRMQLVLLISTSDGRRFLVSLRKLRKIVQFGYDLAASRLPAECPCSAK
mmetsp:Transcript_77871/g.140495  ORF Transcript_77871/g.140495 Transcript_77871/m.140495 type:complete len:94 (+) Transcript_77871:113-394(+)